MKVSDIQKVTLHFIGGTPTSYLVPVSEVPTFVEASTRLHFKPGVNPHNGEPTAKIWQITVAELECRGPFWWTVPDLQNNGDPKGARILDGGTERTAFIDNEAIHRWEAEEAEAEARYHRDQERRYADTSAEQPSQTTGD